MSRQPSPGPALQNQQSGYYRDQHGNPIEKPGPHIKIVYRGAEQHNAQIQNQAAATPIPVVATSSSTGRSKTRAYQSGIAAGAEDVKYAAKYRDLKQKVKEIEADNDRLVFKVLQAKRGIQRAKLERAILYERLGALPASPPQGAVPLPPQHVVQPPVPSGGQVAQHPEAHAYGQSSRHHRAPGGAPPTHHHHRQHHQQPIQPAPPVHVSPPQHHATAHHHPHHPPHDAAHPGQLPITHAQQVMTIETREGPLLVVAGPDGHPVTTADGHFIPAQEMHPPPASSGMRKRGGRVNKEQREIREREEMERKQALLVGGAANSSGSVVQVGGAPQGMPMSHERERERERDWDVERELRERDRLQRREGQEHDRERERERHAHHAHHHHRMHGHHHHHHQHSVERGGSPPPPLDVPPPPERGVSPPQPPAPAHAHRSHSHSSHASYRSHGGGHHHVHTHSHHSHSASPLLSPGGSSYPSTRIHNHQRVGPGSYVLRDRTAPEVPPPAPPPETNAPTPVPASDTPSQIDRESSTNAPTPTPGGGAATGSRIPTPPYMPRSGRTDVFNNDPDAEGHIVGIRGDVPSASEEGSGAQSVATTP